MRNSLRTARCAPARRCFPGFVATLLLAPLATAGFTTPAVGAASSLSKITIEATRERKLRHKVDRFVASVVVRPPSHESLLRWNKPICPLVVGLPRNMGEFMLARLSQAAREAHAPLAGRHCQANLFVVVTSQPERVLRKWMARDPKVNTRHGLAPLRHFLDSTQPVRVWYNPEPGCSGPVNRGSVGAAELGTVIAPIKAPHSGTGSPSSGMGPVYCDDTIDTHLMYGDVRSIAYAIVVADTNRLGHVTLGQLAGYVSLVGLVDVRSKADGGGAPTILRLFRDPNPPRGLTSWDRALLYSLYNTSQSGKLQLTDMEVAMTRRINP